MSRLVDFSCYGSVASDCRGLENQEAVGSVVELQWAELRSDY